MFVRASLYKRREENQLDATECFIALMTTTGNTPTRTSHTFNTFDTHYPPHSPRHTIT